MQKNTISFFLQEEIVSSHWKKQHQTIAAAVTLTFRHKGRSAKRKAETVRRVPTTQTQCKEKSSCIAAKCT